MDKTILEDLMDKNAAGMLDQNEQEFLTNYLKDHPEFQKELDFQVNLVQGVKYAGNEELRATLNEIHGNKKIKGSNFFKLIAMILLAFLVAFLAYNYFSKSEIASSTPEPKQLYATHYAPYKASLEVRGDETDSIVSVFNSYYISKDYKNVLAIADQMDRKSNDILLMASIAAIEEGYYDLAIAQLNEIIANEDYFFSDHAVWYKAMVYLKIEKLDEIETLIKPLINNPKADHHIEAKELIQQLNNRTIQ